MAYTAPLPAIPTSDTETYEQPELLITYVEALPAIDKPTTVHSSKPRSKPLKKIVLSFVILTLCTLCCVLLAIHLKQAQNSKNISANALQGNDAWVFCGDNTQQYGLSRGMPKSLSSISACFWLKTPYSYLKNHSPTVISYATKSSENEFYISVKSFIGVAHGYYAHARTPENVGNIADDKFHHLCVTWDLSNGPLNMYVDGSNIFTTNVQTTNIAAGGTWVIGQDQDRLGGGFQAKDSIKGVLAEVNVWDRILYSYEIAALASSCCSITNGSVKAHDDFEPQGGILTFKPECCRN